MNYPSGGFPAQQPQEPGGQQQYVPYHQQQGAGAPGGPGGPGFKVDPGLIANLVVAGLGLLILFFGFISLGGDRSFFETGAAWVQALFLLAGLTAILGVLPGDQKPGAWPVIFSVTGTLTFMFSVFELGSLDTGGILVLVFGILQTLAAVGAYLVAEGVIKLPPPGQQQFGQQPGYGPQQAYGQQFGQGQAPPQPGAQQTTYTGHQGQFGQQPPQG